MDKAKRINKIHELAIRGLTRMRAERHSCLYCRNKVLLNIVFKISSGDQ